MTIYRVQASGWANLDDEVQAFKREYEAGTVIEKRPDDALFPGGNKDRIWQRKVRLLLTGQFNIVTLEVIQSLQPGKGYASKALSWLTQLADKHQVILDTQPHAFGDTPDQMNSAELEQWYVKFGFVQTSIRRGQVSMRRVPQ